jgi:hypothetical protein
MTPYRDKNHSGLERLLFTKVTHLLRSWAGSLINHETISVSQLDRDIKAMENK